MMTKLFIYYSLSVILLFCSCAPKITTQVLREYPPLPDDQSVIIYELEEEAPANAQIIGLIQITNPKSSFKTYPSMITAVTEETKKMGGDGYKITNYYRPDFWSSLHQIQGAALKHMPSDSIITGEDIIDNFTVTDYNRMIESQPKTIFKAIPYEISFNFGYGGILTSTEGLTGNEKRLENRLNNGIVWEVDFQRTYKKGFGWGIIYNGYRSSANYNYVYYRGLVNYVAPMFVAKRERGKWVYKQKLGIGYLGYQQKLTQGDLSGTVTASSVGFNWSVGNDYKITNYLGIGLEVGFSGGSFGKWKLNNLEYVKGREPQEGERIRVGRINIMLGIRYYPGKKE